MGAGPRRPKDARTALKRTFQWTRPFLPILIIGLLCTMAGVMLAIIPTVLLLIIGQRQLVRGLTTGAVKG